MPTILMVPIHLDALYLKNDQTVVEAMADFRRLPYFNGERDINASAANLSEEILSQPLQDQALYLKAGLHLHWALPDALTQGISQGNELIFPSVPNRWLVTRTDNNGNLKQWVVESDYLHPPNDSDQQSGISYPYQDNPPPARLPHQPFRTVGRKMLLAAWKNRNETTQHSAPQYLDNLTAVGYGEPNFAAFYPNCHSVFGFHDADYADGSFERLSGVKYDVIGWYSDPQKDCLQTHTFLTAIEATRSKYNLETASEAIKAEALRDEYSWTVTEDITVFPERTVYYAQLTVQATQFVDRLTAERMVEVAVGNTSTEALSAYLAHKVAGDKPILEDQLEALHLATRLEGQRLDIGPKFREARHEKEFTAVPAGTIWTIRPEGAGPPHPQAQDGAPVQVTLPDDLAHSLNHLNLHQQAYDLAHYKIESMRKQLYAEWCKYMLCAYPPEDAIDDYPDIDEVKYFIERNSLYPLQRQLTKTNALDFQRQQSVQQVYRRVADLQLLAPADIHDWSRFQAAVRDRAKQIHVAYILGLLPEATRSHLLQTSPPDQEHHEQIVNGLNDLLKRPDLYQAAIFENIKDQLTVEAWNLAHQLDNIKVTDRPYHQVLRLNRLLLEASFSAMRRSIPYTLRQVSAPRYWQPNEPVVLIVDEAVQPTPRHGEDGRLNPDGWLECQLLPLADTPTDAHFLSETTIAQTSETIRAKINELNPGQGEKIGFTFWQEQPWHPFMLEWAIELFPIKHNNNLHAQSRAYSPDSITNNYQLFENAVDLRLKAGQASLQKAANIYSGRAILTSHANVQLKKQIEVYLEKQLLAAYYQAKNIDPAARSNDYFLKHRQTILDWYNEKPAAEKNAVIDNILAVYAYIAYEGFSPLTQSLGGFNEALLMHKQTMQLPISDPLGFEDYQAFADAVRVAVDRQNRSAPQPLNDFNPIRSGVLKIIDLRLVDTFGRVQRLKFNQIQTTEVMTTPAQPHLTFLRPRLAQPARLNFRWLAADRGAIQDPDEPEMNAHPATSPICGWLLPNHLEGSLMVYDPQGQALGSINQNGHWTHAPGRRPIEAWQIPGHLNTLINYLIGQDASFLENFLKAIESALETIDPEDFAHHEALALLMGRPIAVARAMLNLELYGQPATNQSWTAFRQAMERDNQLTERLAAPYPNPESDNFTQVQFPIRIGEYRQLNDGLLGYLKENWSDDGTYTYEDNIFYGNNSQTANILQSIDSPLQKLTMLLDPRGAVHAVTGILPTKAIKIPPDQYAQALRNIEVTFLTASILTGPDPIKLPLPTEPGYAWSWVVKENGVWTDVTDIGPVNDKAAFDGPQVLREGWLKLRKADD